MSCLPWPDCITAFIFSLVALLSSGSLLVSYVLISKRQAEADMRGLALIRQQGGNDTQMVEAALRAHSLKTARDLGLGQRQ